MSDAEQSKRMRLMRHIVEKFDTYWWADQLLHDALAVEQSTTTQVWRMTVMLRSGYQRKAALR